MNQTGRILLMLIIFISTFSFVQAQRGGQGPNAEKMADRTTSVMVDSLALSDAQKEKIAKVNLDYAKRMIEIRQQARSSTDGDKPTNVREAMQELRAEQKVEIEKYLTAEQSAKWDKIKVNRRYNRKGERPRGGRKGKKGPKGNKIKTGEIDPENN